MIDQDQQRHDDIIRRNRKGQKPTAEERNWILNNINAALCLNEMSAVISRITKRSTKKQTIYVLEMSDNQQLEIPGVVKLKSQTYVLNRLSEVLDSPVNLGRNPQGHTHSWSKLVEALLAVVEPVDAVEGIVLNQNTVREWIRTHVHTEGLYGTDSWDEARNHKRPVLDGEWVWFYPQRIVKEKGLEGGDMHEFYAVLRDMGIETKSKKINSKVYKAHRMMWQLFFNDEDDLHAYGKKTNEIE